MFKSLLLPLILSLLNMKQNEKQDIPENTAQLISYQIVLTYNQKTPYKTRTMQSDIQ